MTSKEAITKLNVLNSYDTPKEKHDQTEECLKVLEEYIRNCDEKLEVLNWLIEKMYVAGGLIELKVCPPNNPTIPKYHNAIETHDIRFNDYIDKIHYLKYGR